MKKPIYSNRLDHIFKSISGSSESELNKFKGNINSLDAEYLKFKPQSLTHFSFYKSDKKSPSRNSIINHVKERNKRGKNVISFENLKLILSQKQKTSVSKENKNLLELSFESELNENEQIPNYNNYSKNKSKQESQSIIYNKINKSENFPNLDKTLKKVQTISPAVIKNNSMSKTTQIFKRKTRNISNNFYTLNSLNKPTEELGEPTQVIKNFVSMSTEVDSMTKHKSSLNSFNTFTNIKASEAGASSHTTSKFRTPYKMKNNDDNKVSLTSSVKFLDDEDLKKVNRFSESNIIENLIKDETSIENKRMEKYKKLMSRSILKGTKSLKEMIENPNNSLDQSMEQKPKYSKLQIFKSSVALNRFLISDFLIGEKGNYSEASKKKIKITSKFYEQKANKVKNKAERIKQTFDLKTFGQTEINGHGIVTNEYSDSGNQKFSEFSFNTFLKEKKRKLKVDFINFRKN
jgi:hypothetical protein